MTLTWGAAAAERPMLLHSGCIVTGADLADRVDAMAAAGAEYELIAAGSKRLRVPVVDDPIVRCSTSEAALSTSTRFVIASSPKRAMQSCMNRCRSCGSRDPVLRLSRAQVESRSTTPWC